MINWILLTYRLPSEPSARRVYVWRKLKRLGAISVFDAVWVLPDTPRTHEQFQWLATEIQEMSGEAMFWRAEVELAGQEEVLVRYFRIQVEDLYRALLERIEQGSIEAVEAAQEYQRIRQKDHFQSEVGLSVREKLLASREDPA